MMSIKFYLPIVVVFILLIMSCKKRNVDQYVDTTQLSTFKIKSKAANSSVLYGGVPEQLQVIINSKSIKWLVNDVAYYLEVSIDNATLQKEDGTLITTETPLSYKDTLLIFEMPSIEKTSSISIQLTAKDLKDPVTPGKIVFQENFHFTLETSDLVVVPAYLSKELFIEGTEDSAVFFIFSNATHHNDIYASISSSNLNASPAIAFTNPNNHIVENTHLATKQEIEWIKKIMGISNQENFEKIPMYISSFSVPFQCLSVAGNSAQVDLKVTSKQSVAEYIDTIHIQESPFHFSAKMIPKVFVLQPNVPLSYDIMVDKKIDPKGKAMRNGYKISFESNNTNYFRLYKNNDTIEEKTGIYQAPKTSLYDLLDTLYYTQYNGGIGGSTYRKGTTLAFTIQNGATKKIFRSYTVNIYEPNPIVEFVFYSFYATASNAIPIENNIYVSGGIGNLVTRPLEKKAYLLIKDENPYASYNVEFYKTNLYGSKTLVEYQIHSNSNPSITEPLKISQSLTHKIANTLPIINDGKGFPSNMKFWCTVVAQDKAQNLADLTGKFQLKSVVYRAYPVFDPAYKDQEMVGGEVVDINISPN